MTDIPVVGEPARTDDLNFRRVVHIFVRTWPFIRPAVKHLAIFVAVSVAIAVYSAVLVFIITGLMNGGIVAGRPLGGLHVAIYDLDPAVYVNVESLSDEARLSPLLAGHPEHDTATGCRRWRCLDPSLLRHLDFPGH